jgi:hypothetical protein
LGFDENTESMAVTGRGSTLNNSTNSPFDPNTTQTNALLAMRLDDDKFNLTLQQLYHSAKCQWFYIFLFLLSIFLILITIADGFKVTSSFGFIAIEALLNLLIAGDFACRIKLIGTHRFF